MTMTGNDRFAILVLHCMVSVCFCLSAIKFSYRIDSSCYVSITYIISPKES